MQASSFVNTIFAIRKKKKNKDQILPKKNEKGNE